ncbi:MAG: metallophosphoesterase family protein, partial [Firmicutes bacterium]|nr:metallophosphoesterase family protein [Bacillota bacterium]
HTHAAVHEEIDGIHIINPGSLSYPRDGNPGSYALITTGPDSFDCRIIYLKDKKPKNSGGLLRSLLNYSDRL